MKISKFISYLLHPINIPIIGVFFYFFLIPTFVSKDLRQLVLLVIIIGGYLFPLFLLFLLKKFQMIESYHIPSIEKRKFPTLLFITLSYIIGNWLFKSSLVDLLGLFYFGYGVSLIISYLLLHLQIKMSLHASAIAGLTGFLIYFSFFFKINMLIFIAVSFALAGIVASSRLNLQAHTFKEVVFGLLVGLSSQLIVFLIYII